MQIPYSKLFSSPMNLEESWSLKFLFNKIFILKNIPNNLLLTRSSYSFVFFFRYDAVIIKQPPVTLSVKKLWKFEKFEKLKITVVLFSSRILENVGRLGGD